MTAFHNLKITEVEKKLKIFYGKDVKELKNVPHDISTSLEVLSNEPFNFNKQESLRVYLTAKGKIKNINFIKI